MLHRVLRVLFLAALLPAAAAPGQSAPTFEVRFDPAVQASPYSGRVYVVLTHEERVEPRQIMGNWFDPPPTFAVDVAGVAPDGSVVIDSGALWFPTRLGDLPAGPYRAQAVARRHPDSPRPGRGPGDLYSEAMTVTIGGGPVTLTLDRVVSEERPFVETETVRLMEIVSPSLSAFHGREMKIRAGVVLPQGWADDPAMRHPVVYSVTGFGGDHRSAFGVERRRPQEADVEPIVVVPDATCYRGHSVFADSENNGPWGRALVEELIPEVDRRFHGAGPAHRYVTGVSSGGWSSLWLQVTYPDAFNGVWSHCPDPVDFRDFQRIDLYAPGSNMYTDSAGNRRPLARRSGKVMIWYDDFCRMERVIGPGGQIHSFEAVFSPRGKDGTPRAFFDRDSGAVDTAVTHTWERYDIRLVLERGWSTLGPKLKGKLHIYAGEVDTFYLEGAVARLGESLTALGSDAEVVTVPGMGHSLYADGHAAMYRTIAENWRRR